MAAAVQSGSSRLQKVLQQARAVFLSTRNQNVKDSGFAADLDRLKRLVCESYVVLYAELWLPLAVIHLQMYPLPR